MPHATGLSLGNGTLIQTGNINTQPVSVEALNQEDSVVISANKGGAPQVVSEGIPQQNTIQSEVAQQFLNPNVSLPFVPNVSAFSAASKGVSQGTQINLSNFAINVNTPIELNGISEQRPEILSLVDFQPIYSDTTNGTLNAVGEFLELQIAARKLRVANIKQLINKLGETEDAKEILKDLRKTYNKHIIAAKQEVNFFISLHEVLRSAKNALKIKTLTSYAEESVLIGPRTFKEFLTEEFLFSDTAYNEFSNTKVLGQFLFDSLTVFAQYSPSLFNVTDFKRIGLMARKPTQYAKEIDITDGKFRFKVEEFKSKTNVFPINMGNRSTFSDFINQLPSDPDDRLKLLIVSMSKEMRVSQALGRKGVNKILLNTFSATSADRDNPFDDIVGRPGLKITDPIVGENSLISLLKISDDNSDYSLPFELAFVRDSDLKTYIPGSKYLIDSIVTSDPPLNLSKLNSYKSRFEKISKDSITLLDELLNLKDSTKNLFCEDVFNLIINDFIAVIDIVIKGRQKINGASTFSSDEYILFAIGLLAIASSDIKLKSQLFQLTLLTGFAGTLIGGEFAIAKVSPFFEKLSKAEIKTLGDLSELQLANQVNNDTLVLNVDEDEGLEDVDDENLSITKDSPTSDILAIRTAIELLIDKVVDRLFFIVKHGSSESASGGLQIPFTKPEFRQIISENKQIFDMIVQFLSSLDSKVNSENGYTLNDDSFKSRFNLLTPSTRVAMAFEIYSSFCKKYIDIGIRSDINNTILFTSNVFTLEETLEAFKSVASGEAQNIVGGLVQVPNPAGQQGFSIETPINNQDEYIFIDSIKSLKDKLLKEDSLIIEMRDRLAKMTNKVVTSFANVQKFFNPNGINGSRLQELSSDIDFFDKISLASEAQIMLAQREVDDYNSHPYLDNVSYYYLTKTSSTENISYLSKRNRPGVPVIFDDGDVTFEVRELLFHILGKEEFNIDNGSNVQILSVGLPAGFSNFINNFVNINQKDFDHVGNKEKDIITINVHRRDIEFEDIVFAPKEYLFELSRFVSRSSIGNNFSIITTPFFNIFQDAHVFMKDYSKLIDGELVSQSNLFSESRYDFLSFQEKSNLIHNHIVSYCLEVYIRLLTGINLSESGFYVNQNIMNGIIDARSKEKFKRLIENYISGISNIPVTLDKLKAASPQLAALLDKIDDIGQEQSFIEKIKPINLPGLSRSAAISVTEDLITFLKTFNPKSLLLGGQAHKVRITTPKLFERIFHLPIDPDDFYIDVKKTNSSTSGQSLLDKLTTDDKIINKNGRFYIKPKPHGTDIDFEEFFVTISTVGKTVI